MSSTTLGTPENAVGRVAKRKVKLQSYRLPMMQFSNAISVTFGLSSPISILHPRYNAQVQAATQDALVAQGRAPPPAASAPSFSASGVASLNTSFEASDPGLGLVLLGARRQSNAGEGGGIGGVERCISQSPRPQNRGASPSSPSPQPPLHRTFSGLIPHPPTPPRDVRSKDAQDEMEFMAYSEVLYRQHVVMESDNDWVTLVEHCWDTLESQQVQAQEGIRRFWLKSEEKSGSESIFSIQLHELRRKYVGDACAYLEISEAAARDGVFEVYVADFQALESAEGADYLASLKASRIREDGEANGAWSPSEKMLPPTEKTSAEQPDLEQQPENDQKIADEAKSEGVENLSILRPLGDEDSAPAADDGEGHTTTPSATSNQSGMSSSDPPLWKDSWGKSPDSKTGLITPSPITPEMKNSAQKTTTESASAERKRQTSGERAMAHLVGYSKEHREHHEAAIRELHMGHADHKKTKAVLNFVEISETDIRRSIEAMWRRVIKDCFAPTSLELQAQATKGLAIQKMTCEEDSARRLIVDDYWALLEDANECLEILHRRSIIFVSLPIFQKRISAEERDHWLDARKRELQRFKKEELDEVEESERQRKAFIKWSEDRLMDRINFGSQETDARLAVMHEGNSAWAIMSCQHEEQLFRLNPGQLEFGDLQHAKATTVVWSRESFNDIYLHECDARRDVQANESDSWGILEKSKEAGHLATLRTWRQNTEVAAEMRHYDLGIAGAHGTTAIAADEEG